MANHTDHHSPDYTPYDDLTINGMDYNDFRFEEGLRELENKWTLYCPELLKLKRNDIPGDFQ